MRSAEICAPDLLVRASKLISSSIKPAEPGKASNPYAIDWHEISLSVEFTEFSNDLAELQRVHPNLSFFFFFFLLLLFLLSPLLNDAAAIRSISTSSSPGPTGPTAKKRLRRRSGSTFTTSSSSTSTSSTGRRRRGANASKCRASTSTRSEGSTFRWTTLSMASFVVRLLLFFIFFFFLSYFIFRQRVQGPGWRRTDQEVQQRRRANGSCFQKVQRSCPLRTVVPHREVVTFFFTA